MVVDVEEGTVIFTCDSSFGVSLMDVAVSAVFAAGFLIFKVMDLTEVEVEGTTAVVRVTAERRDDGCGCCC